LVLTGGNRDRAVVAVDPDRVCTNAKHNREVCDITEWRPGQGNNRRDLVVSWDEPIRPLAIAYRFTCDNDGSCSSCDSWKITFDASDGSDSSVSEDTTEVGIHCYRFYFLFMA